MANILITVYEASAVTYMLPEEDYNADEENFYEGVVVSRKPLECDVVDVRKEA